MASSGKSSTAKKSTSTAKRSTSSKGTSSSSKSSAKKTSGTGTKKAAASSVSVSPQRSGSGSRKTSSYNSSGTRRTTGSSSGRAASAAAKTASRKKNSMTGEIVVILLAAFCVFLFCSNLGLCGQLGLFMKNIMRGTMGIFGYAFPVFLPLCALFAVLAKDKVRAGIKIGTAVIVYTIFCGIAEMIAGKFTAGELEWMVFYNRSLTETGGGLAGGMWCKLLYPSLGLFGSYLVLVVLALVGLLIITEKSLLSPLKRSGERMLHNAREDMELRREEREHRRQEKEALRDEQRELEREERRYRMDNPVKGVARNVDLGGSRSTGTVSGDHYQGMINGKPVAMTAEELEREHNTEEIIYTENYGAEKKSSVYGYDTGNAGNTGANISDTVGTEPKVTEIRSKSSRQKNGRGERRSVSAAFTNIIIPKRETPVEEPTEKISTFEDTDELISTGVKSGAKAGGNAAVTNGEKVGGSAPVQRDVLSELTITGLDGLDELKKDDVITARQESRTLSELESLDSLHSGFSRRRTTSVPDMLFTPEDSFESRPGDGSRIYEEPTVQEEIEAPVDNTPLTLNSLRSRKAADMSEMNENPSSGNTFTEVSSGEKNFDSDSERNTSEQNMPIHFVEDSDNTRSSMRVVQSADEPDTQKTPANERGGDTLKIVTAGGRVIEVDNDPTTDPLTAKRAGLSQGQAAMTRQDLVREENSSQTAPMRTGQGATRSSSGFSGSGTYSTAGQTTRSGAPAGNGPSVSTPKLDPVVPKKKLKPYEKPPLRLLNAPQKKTGANKESELRETAMKLQQTLQNFGVGATVTNISCGPSVTRYELIPDQGVKVSKFLSLTDDIKLNLAAADIRMEAPIPGKSAIGIEVPNKEKTMVCLREVMECEEFLKHPSKLAIAVGKDIAGNTIVADIARMPHMLVAGTTGSGKSVFVNTMIVSMLYKATPDEVKFIMIDPKMVEFRIYNGIPHLLTPVVTDQKKAAEVLNWAVVQMTDRYKKFAELNVRDIKGYNEKRKAEVEDGEKPDLMPQIVIIVDELSDLMMAAPSEVEDAIVRLAQMARAAGIHLILATQRPSVNVVTGLIKANIPSRVALSVSTGVDSRTIIDMNGAEKLLGNGDMLFYPSGYQKPLRVQGAFVSDKEILQLVEFLSERGEAHFDESIEAKMVQNSSGSAPSSDRDEYFEKAGRFIVESKKASIGNLQRMFKIGFNRAARIMDQLAEAGVVGAEEGTKARKILMEPEEFEEYLRNQ